MVDTGSSDLTHENAADGDGTDRTTQSAQRMGDVLTDARVAMGLERSALATELRISERYLKAIETMQVGPIPKGYLSAYLRSYSSRLGLDGDDVVERYTRQCGAVNEIVKPATIETPDLSQSRAPVAAMVGVAIAALIGAGAAWVAIAGGAEEPAPLVMAEAAPVNGVRQSLFDEPVRAAAAPIDLPLSLVAQRQAWIEVRGADGTVFRSRVMASGEDYHPRLGAGWTISARDGGAFLWRVGDIDIAPLGPDGAAVYAASVDAAAATAADIAAPSLAARDGETAAN
ncbi:MAG: helix-turn-helix domain-containing protein [Pseudomonadota bacterium]